MNNNENNNGSFYLKRSRLYENCFDCLCRNGLENTTTRMLSEACGVSMGTLFGYYFSGKDEAIVESTAWCMQKVGDDLVASMPRSIEEMEVFVLEAPYMMLEKWGVKLRFMYQIYLSPKFRENGIAFMDGMVERYTDYAKALAPEIGISEEIIVPLTFWLVRICVHFALFESEAYLKPQTDLMLLIVKELKEKYPNGTEI